ncbi:MAG: methionine--tRNA ligase subunit beta, partial [Syntrophales bacterium]|nr:methionine--tRNA ligase subunit beta [Syntrophales bacterium]
MSKSLGNVVRPLDLKDKYGLDAFRYFLLRDMVFGLDSNFSEEALVQRLNSDLANDLGNLVSRVLSMAVRYFGETAPGPSGTEESDRALIGRAEALPREVEAAFQELGFHKALIAIWEFINLTNKYIVEAEPWVLAKKPEGRERLGTVIYNVLEALRVIAVLIEPFMPDTAGKILAWTGAGGAGQNLDSIRKWGGLKPGAPVKRGEALFPRVEFKKEEEAPARPAFKSKPEITLDEFQKVDLRAAKIVAAEAVQGSSKLVKLRIDIGEERTIVAGIGLDYKPEDLVGKWIVVVANLKPAKLMGVESKGMLLAASAGRELSLLSFDKEPEPGGSIK